MYFCTLYSKYIYFTRTTIIYRNRYSLQPSNQVRACDAACQGEAALGGAAGRGRWSWCQLARPHNKHLLTSHSAFVNY